MFTTRGLCSVCKLPSKSIVNTNINHYFGWESCNKDDCNQIIKYSYISTVVKKEELVKKYGNFIKIKRTNGLIDDTWEFDSDAQQEENNGEFWVFVKNQQLNKRKEITLEQIKELN
tara:strand:- start:122 stop:469 length:348 start_codon:yes stop_codon:yes gene_type:complete